MKRFVLVALATAATFTAEAQNKGAFRGIDKDAFSFR